MSESDHHQREFRLVEPEWLEALRTGSQADSKVAFQWIRRRSRRVVGGWYRGSITEDELDDIFASAITETLPYVLDDNATAAEVGRELERSLEKHKKRTKREHLRTASRDTDTLTSHEDFFQTREQIIDLQRLVSEIGEILDEALSALPERDRRMLIEAYRLEGLVRKTEGPGPTFRTAAGKRKALERARKRFNEVVEERLDATVRTTKFDREVLQNALSVVRGGELPTALALAER